MARSCPASRVALSACDNGGSSLTYAYVRPANQPPLLGGFVSGPDRTKRLAAVLIRIILSFFKSSSCYCPQINHRSWADFFLDLYLTEGRAAMLSRMIVFFLFPCILCSSVTFRAIILFKRQTIADKKVRRQRKC